MVNLVISLIRLHFYILHIPWNSVYATHKRRLPSKTPGSWTGEMKTFQHNELFACFYQVNWVKTLQYLEGMSVEA